MSPFYRLAPFIQEYIWNHHWDELRDVQVQAISEILDSPNHVLIAAGTASGKTEAAFFPMLTKLTQSPVNSFGILYIGPLKALINDQFERITDLLEEADFPIYAWHGDRSQSEKKRAAVRPKGVLQITPEALEGLLMNRSGDVVRMFAELQFVVIDELHAFMGTDRGLQLQCQLTRIDRMLDRSVRRVGLSATIHDYTAARRWLSAGTKLDCSLVESGEGARKLDLKMEHYILPVNDEDSAGLIKQQLFDDLYHQVWGRKCLIFTNSRGETEEAVCALRERAERRGEPDCFYAHHGSISAMLREEAENKLRETDKPAVAVATRTLELGIDLGGLDRVVQLGAPSTCSSFVQRLGRTGRRGTRAVMRFITTSKPEGESDFEDLPWELLQNIAIVQLYIEEHWVESFADKPCPYSVLFHQTLSLLMQAELSPKELARRIYAMPAFASVVQQDYLALLRHLLATDVIEKTETGTLIPGLLGERIAGNYRFLSVFADNSGFRVMYHQREIGEVDSVPDVQKTILLAGKRWLVTEIDTERKVIYVVPSKGPKKVLWNSGGIDIDDRIVQRMRQVLLEEKEYLYLTPGTKDILVEARKRAANMDLEAPYSILGDQQLLLHPWLGSRKMHTLLFLLNKALAEKLRIQFARFVGMRMGIFLYTELPAAEFWEHLVCALNSIAPEDIVPIAPSTPVDRYDSQVPEELRRKAYVYNCLDINGLKDVLFPSKKTLLQQ